MISYEHPLSERIRTLLRLEDLYERALYFIAKADPQEHHVALLCLFEILEVAGRADLKSDLLQELERQKQSLESLRDNPDISQEALDNILWEIDRTSSRLFQMSGKVGQELRELGADQRILELHPVVIAIDEVAEVEPTTECHPPHPAR